MQGLPKELSDFHPLLVKLWLFVLVLQAYLVSAITKHAFCQIGKSYMRDFERMVIIQFQQVCGCEFYFGMIDT